MRTTITIDDRLARRLRDEMRASGSNFRKTLEDVLERGLEKQSAPVGGGNFRVTPRRMGLRAGTDSERLHDLETNLEVDHFLGVTRKLENSQ